MPGRLRGNSTQGGGVGSHDFFAFNAANQVWNGAAFVAWADADFALYRILATESGTSGRYTGDEPAGATHCELRTRGATLALSNVVWTESLALPDSAPGSDGGLILGWKQVLVPHTGNATTSGTNLRTAVEGAASGTEVLIETGDYDVGATALVFPLGVSLRGIDREASIVRSSLAAGPSFVPGSLSTFRNVTLQNTGTTGHVFGLTGVQTVPNAVVRKARLVGGADGLHFSSSVVSLITLEDVVIRTGANGVNVSGAAHEIRLQNVQVILLGAAAVAGINVAGAVNLRGGRVWVELPAAAAGVALKMAGSAQVGLVDSFLYALGASVSLDGTAAARLIACDFDRTRIVNGAQLTDLSSWLGGTVTIQATVNTSGPGGQETTLTVNNTTTGQPVADADVWLSSDPAGDVVIWDGQTDSNGVARKNGAKPLLTNGTTLYFNAQKDGVIDVRNKLFTVVVG